MKITSVGVLATSAIIVAIAATPKVADAAGQWRTFHPSLCMPACTQSGGCNGWPTVPSYSQANGGEVQATSSSAATMLMCPVVSDSSVQANTSTVSATLSGYAN